MGLTPSLPPLRRRAAVDLCATALSFLGAACAHKHAAAPDTHAAIPWPTDTAHMRFFTPNLIGLEHPQDIEMSQVRCRRTDLVLRAKPVGDPAGNGYDGFHLSSIEHWDPEAFRPDASGIIDICTFRLQDGHRVRFDIVASDTNEPGYGSPWLVGPPR